MNLFYEIKTGKTFEEAIKSIKENIAQTNFSVLWELNFKDKLQEKGLDYTNDFQVMEICDPEKAKQVLDENIEVGYFLPCKLVVYEKENSVLMGMVKPSLLIGMLGKNELNDMALQVEQDLRGILDKASK